MLRTLHNLRAIINGNAVSGLLSIILRDITAVSQRVRSESRVAYLKFGRGRNEPDNTF
jgi:hypothetical protein